MDDVGFNNEVDEEEEDVDDEEELVAKGSTEFFLIFTVSVPLLTFGEEDPSPVSSSPPSVMEHDSRA